MKTGDRIKIIYVCAPFINYDFLGKESTITVTESGLIYLDDFDIFISQRLIKLIDDEQEEIENNVFIPTIEAMTEIKKTD